jgi:hypothetical protein
MAVTRCSLSTLTSRAVSALNAGVAATYGTTLADDRRSAGEITAAILAADARVCTARAKRWGDGYRSLFLGDSGSIPHAGKIPDHLGPIEQVVIKHASGDSDYKAGKTDESLTLGDVENWRANGVAVYGAAHDAAESVIAGFYKEVGLQLFYTGSDAKAQIANVARTGACQAPEVDEDMVLGLALESLIKEGDRGDVVATLIKSAQAQIAALEAPQIIQAARAV